jgi:hypothetical protein
MIEAQQRLTLASSRITPSSTSFPTFASFTTNRFHSTSPFSRPDEFIHELKYQIRLHPRLKIKHHYQKREGMNPIKLILLVTAIFAIYVTTTPTPTPKKDGLKYISPRNETEEATDRLLFHTDLLDFYTKGAMKKDPVEVD